MQIFHRKGLKACRYRCLWGVLESSLYGEWTWNWGSMLAGLLSHCEGSLHLPTIQACEKRPEEQVAMNSWSDDDVKVRGEHGNIPEDRDKGPGRDHSSQALKASTWQEGDQDSGDKIWSRGLSISSISIIIFPHILAWALKCISLICRGRLLTAVPVPLLTMATVGWEQTDLAIFLHTQH